MQVKCMGTHTRDRVGRMFDDKQISKHDTIHLTIPHPGHPGETHGETCIFRDPSGDMITTALYDHACIQRSGLTLAIPFPLNPSYVHELVLCTIHNFQGWNSHSARLAPDGATLNTSTRKARSAPISVIGGVRCQTPFDTEPSNEDVENASNITRGYVRSHGPRSDNGKQTKTRRERQLWIPSRRQWRKPCRPCGTYRHSTTHHSPF